MCFGGHAYEFNMSSSTWGYPVCNLANSEHTLMNSWRSELLLLCLGPLVESLTECHVTTEGLVTWRCSSSSTKITLNGLPLQSAWTTLPNLGESNWANTWYSYLAIMPGSLLELGSLKTDFTVCDISPKILLEQLTRATFVFFDCKHYMGRCLFFYTASNVCQNNSLSARTRLDGCSVHGQMQHKNMMEQTTHMQHLCCCIWTCKSCFFTLIELSYWSSQNWKVRLELWAEPFSFSP